MHLLTKKVARITIATLFLTDSNFILPFRAVSPRSATTAAAMSTSIPAAITTTQRLAQTLLSITAQHSNILPAPSTCLAIAGGGGGSISALASTPGASSLLLEGIVVYGKRSSVEYIAKHPPTPLPLYQVQSKESEALFASREMPSFSSKEAALALANAAMHRSFELSSASLSSYANCIGVGCTSALGSTRPRRGLHKCHVALMSADGMCKLYNCVLDKECGRTRQEEDEIVSSICILAMLRHLRDSLALSEENGVFALQNELEGKIETMTQEILVKSNGKEVVQEEIFFPSVTQSTGKEKFTLPKCVVGASEKDSELSDVLLEKWSKANLTEGAERVIGGRSKAVLVVPSSTSEMMALSHSVLSEDTIIFPGSFNPPHQGHFGLANAAVDAIVEKRKKERQAAKQQASNENLDGQHFISWEIDDAEDDVISPPSVIFEMSLTNADKPPMESQEAVRRLNSFAASMVDERKEMLPKDWGVMLTAAPLFSQKVEVLGHGICEKVNAHTPPSTKRKMSFVIGTDTMVRILNPKYYNNSNDAMMQSIRDMDQQGVHFVVGGRLEQGKKDGEVKFISGAEELEDLPEDVKSMFTILGEDAFRVDLSSSELRAKQKK